MLKFSRKKWLLRKKWRGWPSRKRWDMHCSLSLPPPARTSKVVFVSQLIFHGFVVLLFTFTFIILLRWWSRALRAQ